MRNSISLFLLLALPFLTFSFEYPYKRLNKLYQSDDEKCLTTAERFIKYFPNNPAPYYFAMSVHFDQAQKQSSARKKYNEMSKALSYARKLDRVDDDAFQSKVDLDSKRRSMNQFTEELIYELKQEKLSQLSKQLVSKRKRLKWEKLEKRTKLDVEVENVKVADVFEVVEVDNVEHVELAPSTTSINGQFFGMANGTELVPSHNVASEKEMLALVNADRKKKGMGPLVWSEDLAKAARYHAYDMGTQDYFSHDSKDRKGEKLVEVGGTFKRIRMFYSDSFVNSENIAAGNEGAQKTYMQWYNSPGHYENMFNASSKKVGIGIVYSPESSYSYYWVFCTAL